MTDIEESQEGRNSPAFRRDGTTYQQTDRQLTDGHEDRQIDPYADRQLDSHIDKQKNSLQIILKDHSILCLVAIDALLSICRIRINSGWGCRIPLLADAL